MTSDPRFSEVTIPAGSTDPVEVTFDEPADSLPRIVTAYGGPDWLLDADPIKTGNVTQHGFEVWSEVALDADLVVQWAITAGEHAK